MKKMNYNKTDKVIDYINKQIVKSFVNMSIVASFDELNTINYIYEVYDKIWAVVKKSLLGLAIAQYQDFNDEGESITELWLLDKMAQYDKVTKYRFDQEFLRKRDRFIESVIASDSKNDEIKKAKKYISRTIAQEVLTITKEATLQAYIDLGATQIIWHTQDDTKVCPLCKSLDGKTFNIDKIPTTHPNCRCWYEMVLL